MIETGHNLTGAGALRRPRLSGQRAAGLLDVTRAALEDAVTLVAGHDEAAYGVRRLLDDLGQPLKVAVAGQVSAGKSTLVNAIVGERVAETGKAETTQVNWWFRQGAGFSCGPACASSGR
jgi:predicted GTPase